MLSRLAVFLVVCIAVVGGGALAVVSASAQTAFRSSNGRFTAELPSGWNVAEQVDSGQVMFSHGKVSASLGVEHTDNGQTPPPDEVLDGITQQLKDQCRTSKVMKHGTAVLSGLTGVFNLVSCERPEGLATLKIAVATSNGQILIFNSAAPATQYAQVLPVLNAVETSFRLSSRGVSDAGSPPDAFASETAQKLRLLEKACANGTLTAAECATKRAALTGSSGSQPSQEQAQRAAAERDFRARMDAMNGTPNNWVLYSAAPGQADSQSRPTENPAGAPQGAAGGWQQLGGPADSSGVYRDPGGRFSVNVPAGWSATPQGENGAEGVEFAHASSWVMIGPFGDAHDPIDVVEQLISQSQARYQGFKMGDHGTTQVNGHNAAWAFCGGRNEKGKLVALRLAGLAAPAGHFLAVFASIPSDQIGAEDQAIEKMFMSISFGQ